MTHSPLRQMDPVEPSGEQLVPACLPMQSTTPPSWPAPAAPPVALPPVPAPLVPPDPAAPPVPVSANFRSLDEHADVMTTSAPQTAHQGLCMRTSPRSKNVEFGSGRAIPKPTFYHRSRLCR